VSDEREADARAQALALELYTLDQPMELYLRPETVLHLVGLLHLALRHPNIDARSSHAGLAANFITAARAYFAACPLVLELIRQGEDPACDVPGTGG
jgi:hypothetical protein